jgi:DNA-directed RNA polymerase subunit beta'
MEARRGLLEVHSPNNFQSGEDFDDENARMAQHVEELQGMIEIDGEDL